jgi:hypothetical protein
MSKPTPRNPTRVELLTGIKETKCGKRGYVDKNRVDTYYEKTEEALFKTTGAYINDKIHLFP